MKTVRVSPKFRDVIPRRMREALGIRPGQKLQVLLYRNRMELLPVEPMKKLRGFLAGINTTVQRDRDRT